MYRVTERGPWLTEGDSELRYSRGPKRGMRRELTITIEARCIVYRAKGTRQAFRITHERAYQLAVQAHADAQPKKRRREVARGVRV